MIKTEFTMFWDIYCWMYMRVPIYYISVEKWNDDSKGIEWKIKTIFFSHNYTAPPNNDDYDDDDYDDDGNWIN